MEKDKQLKDLLLNGGEGASAHFTEAVMQRVILAGTAFYYPSLISPKLKRIFVFSFGAMVAVVIALCLIIALRNLPFTGWMQAMVLSDLNYEMILMFILTFWIVYAINSLIIKKPILSNPFM